MAKVTMKETESVRLDKKVVNRARRYVKDTQQTLGGFISVEINSILEKIQPSKSGNKKQEA